MPAKATAVLIAFTIAQTAHASRIKDEIVPTIPFDMGIEQQIQSKPTPPVPDLWRLDHEEINSPELEKALALLRDGKIEDAFKQTKAALAAGEPRKSAGLELLGVILVLKGQIDEGRSQIEEAVRLEPRRWSALLKLGDIAYARRDLPTTRKHWTVAATIRPNESLVLQRLGLLAQLDGKIAQAQELFEKSLPGLDADSAGIRINLGMIYNAQQLYSRTIALLGKNERFFRDPAACVVLGMAHVGLSQYPEAKSAIEKALKSDPNHVGARLLRGKILGIEGNQNAALADLEEVVRLQPDWPQGLAEIGRIKTFLGRKDEGIKAIEQAIRLSNSSSQYRFLLADTYAKTQDIDKAIALYKELANQKDSKITASLLLADLLASQRRFADASQIIDNLLASEKNNPAVLRQKGMLQAGQRKYDEAIDSFRKALVFAPGHPDIVMPLAMAYRQKGDFKSALAHAEKLAKSTPDNQKTQMFLAVTYDDANELRLASEAYQRIIRRFPDNWVALNNQAMVYSRLDKHVEAEQAARALMKLAGNIPEAMDTAGWVLFKAGKKDEGYKILKATANQNQQPKIIYHLGLAAEAIGNSAEAQQYLAAALEKNLPEPMAADAKKRLKQSVPAVSTK